MKTKDNKTTNLHIYPSNIRHETRILKETRSIADLGLFDKIIIVGIWENGLEKRESLDSKREICRLPLKSSVLPRSSFWKFFKYIEWLFKVFFIFKDYNIALVNCHSLPVLFIGLLFKTFNKSKVVYDTHELETETERLSKIRKFFSKIFERLFISHVDSIIVVSNSIADWYKKHYRLKKIYTVRNFPYQYSIKFDASKILKDKFKIDEDKILFIYQGALSKGRGIELLLNIFPKLTNDKHIVFMGYGPLENHVREFENNFSNIHFQPAVKQVDIAYYTSSADIGISIILNTCLSYYYSLPNKFFEYITSGLPVIVSDFPEMAHIVDENAIGWKVSVNELSISTLIKNISKRDIEEKRKNVLNCKDTFNWETESKKLSKLYEELFVKLQ